MPTKLKYTALSRAKKLEQVSFSNRPFIKEPNKDILPKKIDEKLQGHLIYDTAKGFENNLKIFHIISKLKKQGNLCCHCCEHVKVFNFEPNDKLQYSIDRINDKIGHVIDNVKMSCWGCNRAKVKV